jgi:hypothetical protein
MNMNATIISLKKKMAKAGVPAKPYAKMTPTQKKAFLKMGAETFAKNYSEVIKKLANE